ncbi:MAG: HAD family phosphatase [Spirochaetia bacterium]|nr:HAD family phosphatase [Spirochaetia bacterium]
MIKVAGMAIQAVAFDMDGLMFDSERVAIELWRSAGLSEGWEIPGPLLLGLVGHSSAEGKRLLVGTLGADFPYDRVRAKRLALEAEYYRDNPIPLKPGLMELLDGFKGAGLPLAVATSTTRPRVLPLLKKAGILERFSFLICGDEVEKPKPDPEIYRKALANFNVAAEHCLVLEDSLAGVSAAHEAKMIVFMVPDVIEPDRGTRAKTARIFKSLTEVSHFLGL